MGRVVLLIPAALALLAAACDVSGPVRMDRTDAPVQEVEDGGPAAAEAASQAPRGPSEGHADLTCVTCHRGNQAEAGPAAVPGSTCAASGCHTDGGPASLVLSTVDFQHRRHGHDTGVAMSCSGCHSHASGGDPLTAGTDACTLCHAEGLRGEESGDCRYCHTRPTFEGLTSQALAIPHDDLPWIQGECVRCHFDVAEPPTRVSAATCTACHADRTRITAAGIGEDLHPTHTGVGCTSCHASGDHHIVAMSSAVNLECSQCHLRTHDVDVTETFPGTGTCNACHRPVHQDQQRLVLGVVGGLEGAPSEKFLDGLTCRSCHFAPAQRAGPGSPQQVAVAGSGASCTGCHRPEYATVLRWWNEGTAQRIRLADSFVGRTEGALAGAGSDSVTALLAEARDLVAMVRRGHGAHNLLLSHGVLARSLEQAGEAWEAAGRTAPPAPDLGRAPRMGACSYCHYRTDQQPLRALTAAEERFHREVLGVRETSRAGG